MDPTLLSQSVIASYEGFNKTLLKYSADPKFSYALQHSQIRESIDKYSTEVKATLGTATSGTALILGFGNGNDIPLCELTNKFSRIILVDIDKSAMQKAIAKLPSIMQTHIDLVQCDLTGMLPFLSKELELLDPTLPEETCLGKVTEIMKAALQEPCILPPLGKHYFVISSFVTTQLYTLIDEYVVTVLEKMHPKIRIALQDQFSDYRTTMNNVAVHICKEHLKLISESTDPTGKIYYADNTYVEIVKSWTVGSKKEPDLKAITKCALMPVLVVREALLELFIPKSSSYWKFTHPLTSSLSQGIRLNQTLTTAIFFLEVSPFRFIKSKNED